MEFNNLEESKSSSEETDRSSCEQIIDHDGRIYECVFCKRGFTTAQALGGHMNIHRKDRANNNNNNKAKPNFIIPPPSSSSKVIDDDEHNYSDLGYYSSIPSHLAIGRGNHHYYSTIVHHHHEVYTNNNNNNNSYHSIYFPPQASYGTTPSSHQVHYNNSEVLCEENYQRDYWRQRDNLSLYTNPLCVHENENNDKILKDKSDEEDGLDLELRLGHHHP